MTEIPLSQPVRAFISYSWSSPTHESWVLGLATRLREDGVDVILDKWDLKPGHDAYHFMETMVADATVTKVIMVCDKTYVEKSNSRSGGVGTESQIISPEVYKQGAQDKFAAVMTEEDESGDAYVPVYYKGRIFFDFRFEDKFEESYEQLLRWLVGRPQYVKPKLGSVPSAILDAAPVASGTLSRARRVEEALRIGARTASGLVREYGDALIHEIQLLGPKKQDDQPFDEAVLKSITSIRPYLNQFSELVATILRFSPDPDLWDRILNIHERLGRLMWRRPDMTHWNEYEFDAFKIAAHNAFLATIALALDEECFDLVETALRRAYLVNENDRGGGRATSDFTVFRQYVASLEHRKQRLSSNRISLDADLLKESYPKGGVPSFESMMQADFILFLRFNIISNPSSNWYPYSLVYASRRFRPFPLFARAESKDFFNKMSLILGVSSVEDFKTNIAKMNAEVRFRNLFDYNGIPVSMLSNIANIGTLP